MSAEPNYTDAQIEAQCTRLKQLEQMGDSFRVTHSEFRSLHDMLRSLLSERQAAMQGQGGEVVAWVGDMKTSAGMDYYVCVGTAHEYGKYLTPNHYKIRGRAEYDVACWNHMLGRGGKPRLSDFDVDTPPPPQPVRSVSEEDVDGAEDAYNEISVTNSCNRKALRAALEAFLKGGECRE